MNREIGKREVFLPTAIGNLVDVSRHWAQEQADSTVYRYLETGEVQGTITEMTFSTLDLRARAVAALLQESLQPGDRALLLYPSDLDFVVGFLACLYAGVIAVPTYPPDITNFAATLLPMRRIITDSTPRAVLTTAAIAGLSKVFPVPELESTHWLVSDTCPDSQAERWHRPRLGADTIAFLQYTSGSTGDPKGVIITHGNLVHNLHLAAVSCGNDSSSVAVCWLPLYHDFGLIGHVLQVLYLGAQCNLMSPLMFLKRPLRWLQAITHFRTTSSGAPNFAYDLCVRKATHDDLVGLDLCCWSGAYNGAEPVRPGTIERFSTTFAPCGFHREAFRAIYGLAEYTVFVSCSSKVGTPRVQAYESALTGGEVVCCGREMLDEWIRIVDPVTRRECPPGRVGEIWLAGPSVSQGYWNRPEETACTFQATLEPLGEGPFLRTGDLGFLHEGELFVTGRCKDLIIIRGHNYYPQDIEKTVESCHPAIRPGCSAAFSVDEGGEERLVVVAEWLGKASQEQVAGAIQEAIGARHMLQLEHLALLPARTIPKTTSGKIRRQACRSAFVEGRWNDQLVKRLPEREAHEENVHDAYCGIAASSGVLNLEVLLEAPVAERKSLLTAYLCEQVAFLSKSSLAPQQREQPLIHLGLDSLSVMELSARVEVDLGIVLPLGEFFTGSISHLAAQLLMHIDAHPQPAGPAQQPPATSPPSPSWMQRVMWQEHTLSPQRNILFEALVLRGKVRLEALAKAMNTLVARHGLLRATLMASESGAEVPRVVIPDSVTVSIQQEDASSWSTGRLKEWLSGEATRCFELDRPPLLRVTLLERSPEERILAIAIHHAVCDGGSLPLLIRELWQLYRAILSGRKAEVPGPPASYQEFVLWEEEMLASPRGRELEEYWLTKLAPPLPLLSLPADGRDLADSSCVDYSVPIRLSEQTIRALRGMARVRGITSNMLLLAACYLWLSHITGQDDLLVASPMSLRRNPRFLRTIGPVYNMVLLRTSLAGASDLADFLDRVRQTVIEAIDHQAYPLGLLAERLGFSLGDKNQPIFQVGYNFLGERATSSGGTSGSIREPRSGSFL